MLMASRNRDVSAAFEFWRQNLGNGMAQLRTAICSHRIFYVLRPLQRLAALIEKNRIATKGRRAVEEP